MEKIEGLAGFAPALLIGSQSTAYLLKVYRSEGREEMWPEYMYRYFGMLKPCMMFGF